MRRYADRIFGLLVRLMCLLSLLLLGFMIFFIVYESIPAIRDVGLRGLLLSRTWRPIIYKDHPEYGMLNMIISTLYVSALSMAIALVIGVGCALFLACRATDRQRRAVMPYIDLLASIPSVVYGFIGLYVVVGFIEKCGRAAGESVLAGGIVLSVMILPYMISSCCETMVHIRDRVAPSSTALGLPRWYMASQLVLPCSARGIMISMALACGRAMGETMAVMMVLGNAIGVPSLLGKGETISSLIALEMGMAEVGSTHFSALYTAGLVLLVLLLAINLIFELIRRRLSKGGLI